MAIPAEAHSRWISGVRASPWARVSATTSDATGSPSRARPTATWWEVSIPNIQVMGSS